MATLRQVKNTHAILEAKQNASDLLAQVIQDVTNSTDTNGDVELTITRTNKRFLVDGSTLVNKLTQKKNNIDSDITTLLATITIT